MMNKISRTQLYYIKIYLAIPAREKVEVNLTSQLQETPTELFNIYFVLTVADYNYCFTYIDVGCNVIVSDGGVFQNCSLYTALENGLLPEGYRLVGDDA